MSPFATQQDVQAARDEDVHVPAGGGGVEFSVAPGSSEAPITHTLQPYVTGNSVLAIKYASGVLMACDMLGAYGSTKRYKSVQRVLKVNDTRTPPLPPSSTSPPQS